jgi:hexosaminidase
MTALSEVLWSGPGAHSYNDFYNRLIHFQNRFDMLGWAYAPGSFIVSIQADQENMETGFRINLTSEKPGESIRFTTDGSEPSIDSPGFNEPFSINKTTTVKTALFMNGKQVGQTTTKTFHFHKAVGKDVQYAISHKQKYPGAGPFTLVDGLTGTTSYNDGYWQGWEGNNLDVVIDLQTIEKITRIEVGLLESQPSWIFLPTHVKVSFSDNGKDFQNERTVALDDGERNGNPNRQVAKIANIEHSSRFIRVQAINRKMCPEWHEGANGMAWVFADEIIIN